MSTNFTGTGHIWQDQAARRLRVIAPFVISVAREFPAALRVMTGIVYRLLMFRSDRWGSLSRQAYLVSTLICSYRAITAGAVLYY